MYTTAKLFALKSAFLRKNKMAVKNQKNRPNEHTTSGPYKKISNAQNVIFGVTESTHS